jgi:YD repeat-containing protein
LVTYSYDNAGQRTKMEDAVGITTYSYDELNRPKVVNYPPGKAITYTYDDVGNRSVMVDPDTGRTTYSYDNRNMLTSLLNPSSERTRAVQ